MNAKQMILRAVHPLWSLFAKMSGRHSMKGINDRNVLPNQPFYDLSFSLANTSEVNMRSFRGKKILIVNTASECVYTTQYSGLQKLQDQFKGKLIVIAFPSNEFKEQEKGSDEEIKEFCTSNFGVKFPVAKKSIVRNREGQHPVFQWLTDAKKNGWNDQQPAWNFSKYLVDEEGKLTHVFGPPVSPLSKEIVSNVRKQV